MKPALICLTLLAIATVVAAQVVNQEIRDLVKELFDLQEEPHAETNTHIVTPIVHRGRPDVVEDRPINDTGSYRRCGFRQQCVPAKLCRNSDIVSDGGGLIDIRSDEMTQCRSGEVCCRIRSKPTDTVTLTPQQEPLCGKRNTLGVRLRVTGDIGDETQFGEFPWMAAIFGERHALEESAVMFQCGGTLLASSVVVTVAHCVQQLAVSSAYVRAGEWDISSSSEPLAHQNRQIREILPHELYDSVSLHNDIALLLVERPFVWDHHIQPVCLPPPSMSFDYSRCLVSAWGIDKYGRGNRYQVLPRKMDLTIVSHGACESTLRRTYLGNTFALHDSFLCALGESRHDTCRGDGGSPLVCPVQGSTDRYYHVGIVAWGIGCGMPRIPGVYMNMTHLLPWIDRKLRTRNVTLSYY